MSRLLPAILFYAVCLSTLISRGAEATPLAEALFARDIQPLLAKHCILCHGPDDAEAGLRLDLADVATSPLESGHRAITAGDADQSELIRRILSDDDSERMPPEGKPLAAAEIELLRKWINGGARYENHWAYQSVAEPPPPSTTDAWVRNPIDNFVLARLQRERIVPSPEADPATLVKRLYYDLVGLPPTPSDVDAFVRKQDADAYEELVDRLLASPRFGERWGRHWLDMARYADSDGYEKDRPRPNAWRYRDWVIDAINHDMPFDEFTIEQLAGDLLPYSSPMQRLATAFHRQTLTNTEGGTDQEEFRVEATFDRAETTGAVWLGLTMTCARCHSHKYDQISQREYYQLFAFFNGTNETNLDVPTSDAAMEEYKHVKQVHDAKLTELTSGHETAKQNLQPEVDAWLAEMTMQIAASADTPLEYHSPVLLDVQATSKSQMTWLEDESIVVTHPPEDAKSEVPDRDKYTLVFEAPVFPLTGIRIETLTDESLGKNGPGRAPNGNFVLSEVKASLSENRKFKDAKAIEFASAEVDFNQVSFSATGVLSNKKDTGWAISPQMGKDHALMLFTKTPINSDGKQFLQLVLDQSYGGKHLIGRFRVTFITGYDPLRVLPNTITDAVTTIADKRTDEQQRAIVDHVATMTPKVSKLAKQIDDLKKKAPTPPIIAAAVMTSADRATRVLHRGDFLQPADDVTTGTLETLSRSHPLVSRHPHLPADRLDLARWLINQNHPLTPRVSVNHIWSHLFGRGIVPTVNDFGVRGELPTHPGLLDWLAWQYPRTMQWSRKTLIKTMVMSATYRQSSTHREELRTLDPTNRLFARQNRWRVEAETVRDLSLAVSGLLSEKIGGPSVFPPLAAGVAELSYANNFKWETSSGEDRYRRGMYTFFKRTSPHPTLINFDCPDSNTTNLSRETSNTPLQALATLNNEVFTEAAQAMAMRLFSECHAKDHERLAYALRMCIARQPTPEEIRSFASLLQSARDYYQSHAADAFSLVGPHVAPKTSTEENAAWVATLRIMLNLDEFIVRD